MRFSSDSPKSKFEEDELLSTPEAEGEAADSHIHTNAAGLNADNLSDDLEFALLGSDEETRIPHSSSPSPSHLRPHSSYPSNRVKLACVACRR